MCAVSVTYVVHVTGVVPVSCVFPMMGIVLVLVMGVVPLTIAIMSVVPVMGDK